MTESSAAYSLAGTDKLAGKPLLLLFMGLFATAVGQAFVFAIMPPLGRSVGLDEVRITAIISTSALVFTLIAPFCARDPIVTGGNHVRHQSRLHGLCR